MVRFLHTADWQLGKPYGRVKDQEKQARLKQLRFDVIERLAEVVQREKLEFVVVAGDLFDSIEPTRADVAQACSAIGAIGVPVLAIPGNHDHGGAGSFWHEAWFKNYKDDLAPNLQPLLERKPLHLPGALILPCPLNRQADTEDPLSWLKNYKFDQLDQRPRVVVAHGSVHGFGADELFDSDDENPLTATNRLNLAALPIESIDYIALGDWHGLKKVAAKAWYSGCPEPDRFPKGDNYKSSQALVVQAERCELPQVKLETTGLGAWHQYKHRFGGDADLDLLDKNLQQLIGSRSGIDLLLLELDGNLSLDAGVKLQNRLQQLEARLLRLKLKDHTKLTPNSSELQQLTARSSDPLIARVAQRLQVLSGSDDQHKAKLALLALRELHWACMEQKYATN